MRFFITFDFFILLRGKETPIASTKRGSENREEQDK